MLAYITYFVIGTVSINSSQNLDFGKLNPKYEKKTLMRDLMHAFIYWLLQRFWKWLICKSRLFCPLTLYNSWNATQTILSPPVLETVSIREINLWNVAEAGAQTSDLYSVAQTSSLATRPPWIDHVESSAAITYMIYLYNYQIFKASQQPTAMVNINYAAILP